MRWCVLYLELCHAHGITGNRDSNLSSACSSSRKRLHNSNGSTGDPKVKSSVYMASNVIPPGSRKHSLNSDEYHYQTSRKLCPHCGESVALKTYKSHKRLYFNEVSVTAKGLYLQLVR